MAEEIVEVWPKPVYRNQHTERPWRVDYSLAYDGGGSSFSQWYRTRRGARISAWWHMHVRSWGGSAKLVRQGGERRG